MPGLRQAATADELAAAVAIAAPAEVAALDALRPGLELAVRASARHAVAILTRLAQEWTPDHIPAGDAPLDLLRQAAVVRATEAAVDGWTANFGLGTGMLTGLACALRHLSGSSDPIPAPPGMVTTTDAPWALAWRVAVVDALRGRQEPLERIRTALELTETELGALFGVSRQAVAQWREKGIPANRASAVSHVVQTVDLLDRKLKAGRLPLVARRPAKRLAGRSIIEALTEDPAHAHEVLAAAFDWSTAA